jgi:uncharacterized protein (DUF1330 family)
MIAVYPTREKLEALLAGPPDQPVVMLNLLRFKTLASAPDAGVSGQEAYNRYGEKMRAIVEGRGGRILWTGRVDAQVIGDSADFHAAALVEYPSRKAFVEIAMSPEVAAIGVHRAAGLEGQWLLAATTTDGL